VPMIDVLRNKLQADNLFWMPLHIYSSIFVCKCLAVKWVLLV
jgi:hypothetical protein